MSMNATSSSTANLPPAFGSGKAARWIPQGFGQMPQELSALLRVAAHDMYSGVDAQGKSYADGDIGIKALYFPDDPAIKPLLEKDYLRNALWQYTQWDYQDDGVFNGTPARQIFADAAWYATGESHHQELYRAPVHQADLSWEALKRPNVDNSTPQGFKTQADWLGLQPHEFFAFENWGHDMLPGQPPLDDGWFNGSTLHNALNNPLHPDYKLTQGIPGIKNFANWLIGQDKQQFGELNGWNLHRWFVDSMFKTFFR
ncbi:MAG: hypothetical protein U0003_00535 [Vampirovibrionales bacterium]